MPQLQCHAKVVLTLDFHKFAVLGINVGKISSNSRVRGLRECVTSSFKSRCGSPGYSCVQGAPQRLKKSELTTGGTRKICRTAIWKIRWRLRSYCGHEAGR